MKNCLDFSGYYIVLYSGKKVLKIDDKMYAVPFGLIL